MNDDDTPICLSIEHVRAELLRGVRIPPDLTNRALSKLSEKVDAKETKFFTHKGKVVETAEVEDHGTQLGAIDKVLSMAGLYAKDKEQPPARLMYGMEIDPNTGVMRLVATLSNALPAQEQRRSVAMKVRGVTTQGIPDEVLRILDVPTEKRVVLDEEVD